ncbi:helix-turn-helix transcriptional regulator [Saccharopolyspora taberi]|uniref:Helix-turn-helix transcriptional regulator n=1 Tax=Saccharopolyspora taberi TaxID=60895 RepID=A0ABN3V1I0_9PSEU
MGGINESHTPKARLLGAELRDLRKAAGLNGRQLAARLGISQPTLSRYESGQRTAPVDIVARVLGTLGIIGERCDELIEFARTASEPNMVADHRGSLHGHLIELAEFERAATRITHVAPLVIPGPLQTRAYATEIMASIPADQRGVRVELRMARGETLRSDRQITAIIMERALREPIGSYTIMAEQVRHLVQLAGRPNITVQVIPSNISRWTLAHNGSFILFEFDKAAPMVHLEHFRGPTFLYGENDVEAYRSELSTLMGAAMSPESSAELMTAVAQQLAERTSDDDGTKQLAEGELFQPE